MLVASTAVQKDTQKSSRCLFSGQRRPFDTPRSGAAVGLSFHASSPQSVGERFLRYVSYVFGRVDFAAMWTAYASPPHSVNKPQCDVAHQKYDHSENCCIRVDDENEIVEVDHILGVPRAGVRMLWIAVWIGARIHRTYWPADGINLPRK